MKETDDPLVHYHYANDLARDGQFAEAVQHYEHAIALDPDNLDSEVYVFSAWLLATCPDVTLRNGQRAVELATKACEDTDWEPWPLTALAAAYAEIGEFGKAIETQKRANDLYEDYTYLEPEYHHRCQDRLARYQVRRTVDYHPGP